MNKKVYVCTGTCKANISEELYKDGLTKCGEKTCTKYNMPFEQRRECSVCRQLFDPKDQHSH